MFIPRFYHHVNTAQGSAVHCVDVDPHSASAGGGYEDTSLVEKFRLTDEAYDQRQGTLRDWGRRQKAADPTFSLRKHQKEHAEMVEARRLYRESGVVRKVVCMRVMTCACC